MDKEDIDLSLRGDRLDSDHLCRLGVRQTPRTRAHCEQKSKMGWGLLQGRLKSIKWMEEEIRA